MRPRSLARAATVLAVVAGSLSSMTPVAARTCWLPPVDAPVTDPFRAPPCPWCPGNRGIEYGTGPGVAVRAVAAGTVTYAGSIAGVGYLVVRHGDGRRVTYGNLTELRHRAGDVVVARSVVGVTAGRFHLGLRHGDRYLDPAPMIGRLVRRPRLVPIDGRRGNPAPPPVLRCE